MRLFWILCIATKTVAMYVVRYAQIRNKKLILFRYLISIQIRYVLFRCDCIVCTKYVSMRIIGVDPNDKRKFSTVSGKYYHSWWKMLLKFENFTCMPLILTDKFAALCPLHHLKIHEYFVFVDVCSVLFYFVPYVLKHLFNSIQNSWQYFMVFYCFTK